MANVRTRLVLVALAAVALGAASGAAADERLDRLPERYRKWLEEEVVYIIDPREREAFLDLGSVEEWDAFIEAFWRRRDPDPLTPVNEFKEEHYKRIEYANRFLGGESAVPGWMTDRGKMYIILGEPQDRETFLAVPGLYPAELWFYPQDKEKGLPPLYLLFFQEHNAGPYRLFNHLLDGPEDLLPAQPFDPENSRMQAYEFLQTINPALAHATITMRADQGAYAGIVQPDRSALDFQTLLSDIYRSPYRRLDVSWVDAAREARGLVESDYLFNYVPSTAAVHVLPGPEGSRFVHYTIEIEPQHMTLVKEENGHVYYTRFELRGEVATPDGETIVHSFTLEPFLQLTESQFLEVQARPFAYRNAFPLVEGRFRFRLVLKNRARSEYTLFESDLEVPPAADGPWLGPPALLYGTARLGEDNEGLYRTYQLGRLRLDPNASRAYSIGEPLVAYVPVENAADGARVRFVVRTRTEPAEEIDRVETTVAALREAGGIEILPLDGVGGGRYELVTELVDEAGAVLATRTSPFDVSPRTRLARPWVLRESVDGERVGVVATELAEQSIRLGRTDAARRFCERAIAADPNLVRPRLVLARFRLDEGEPLEAVRLLEPAYAKVKDDAELALTLGDAHFKLGNYERAATIFEAALPLRRPDPALLNALALCYTQRGERAKAVEYLKRSLDLLPDQPATRELLEKLSSADPPHED